MYLWVVRHAIAFPREETPAGLDPERPLTLKGRDRMEAAAIGIKHLGARPERIVTSPYVRAHQTAEICAQFLGVPEVELTESLEPDQDPMVLLQELEDQPDVDTMVVGHAPHVDLLVARLVRAPRPFTAMKKGSAACFELYGGPTSPGHLHWLHTPKQLRALEPK